MTWQKLKDNLPLVIAMILCIGLLFWTVACPPRTQSIVSPETKVTAAELQLELDTIISTARLRMADLEKQQEFRDIILQNALLVIQTGTFNPLGIVTSLLTFYGVGSIANSTRKVVKKKVEERKLVKKLNNNRGDV